MQVPPDTVKLGSLTMGDTFRRIVPANGDTPAQYPLCGFYRNNDGTCECVEVRTFYPFTSGAGEGVIPIAVKVVPCTG